MSKVDDTIVSLTLAKGEIEFAIAKASQAKLAEELGQVQNFVNSELALGLEAAGRADNHLRALLGLKSTSEELELIMTGGGMVFEDGGRMPDRKLSDLEDVGPSKSGHLRKFD